MMKYLKECCTGRKGVDTNDLDLNIKQDNINKQNGSEEADRQAQVKIFIEFYHLVNKLIKDLHNVKLEKPLDNPDNTDNTFKAIEQIIKEHDNQKKDIDVMKVNIKSITNDAGKEDSKIKDVVKLKTIEDKEELKTTFEKVAYNLKEVIKTLEKKVTDNETLSGTVKTLDREKQEAEGKLVNISQSLTTLKNTITNDNTLKDIIDHTVDNLEDVENGQNIGQKLNNAFTNIKTRIDKDKKEADILAQSNIVNLDAPNNITALHNNNFLLAKDMFNKDVEVKFLSYDRKKIMTKIEIHDNNQYQQGNYDKAQFYYFDQNEYKPLNNLTAIKNLDTNNIILAFHKNQ